MIFDAIQEWFQELLIDGIISNLTGMFDTLNTKVGEIAGEVGMTPSAWNSGIFNMVRSLSETVIVPIASIVLTFVMCYELIQLIVEKNNLHDFDTWIFFKWIFKTFCAVLIVTNTWNIVMAVFHRHIRRDRRPGDPARGLEHRRPAGAVVPEHLRGAVYADPLHLHLPGDLWQDDRGVFGDLDRSHPLCHDGEPGMGQHGAELSPLPAGPGLPGVPHNISGAIWGCMGYTVLLCFTLFKTGSLAKSLFGAH